MRAVLVCLLLGCGPSVGSDDAGRCGGDQLGVCAPSVDDAGRITARPVCHLRRGVASCVEPSALFCGPGFPPCLVGTCTLDGLCQP